MNTKELVEYSIKKYGRTYKALGGHWFWKRWYDFLGLFKKSEFKKLLRQKGKRSIKGKSQGT